MQNYIIWILTALLSKLKLKIVMKISQMMLKRRYDKSNFEVDRPLPKGMNKNVIGLMKGELGEKIITKLVALRRKTH